MIVLTCTLVGLLAIGTARFGRKGLLRLAMIRFNNGWFLLIACLAQGCNMIIQQQRLLFLLITASMLIWFCWKNRYQVGMSLITIGISLNMLVMAANGGVMPVSPSTAATLWGITAETNTSFQWSKSMVLAPQEMQFAWLSDHVFLPGPFRNIAAWSIGDFFLIVGLALAIWSIMKGSKTRDNDDDMYSNTTKHSSLLS